MSKKKLSFKQKVLALPRRTKLIVVFSVLGVIVAGVVITLIIIVNQKKPEDVSINGSRKARHEAALKQVQRDGAIRDSAEEAVDLGDFNKANDIYAQAIQAEHDSSRKVQLAIDQSSILYTAGKYPEAIKVAQDADVYSDDKFLVSDWLSRIYEDQRQYQLAAQNYTMAGKFASSPTNKTGFDKSYYDQQAARVSALVGH